MQLSGRYRIAADRETVWKNLNDPDVLKKCVPGCQSFEEGVDDAGQRMFNAAAKLKIGPVNALFTGFVKIEDAQAPRGYRLRGEGKGGVAGFGKGFADVALSEVEGGAATHLNYKGEAQVGGKLASIGSRLVGGTVKKLAGEFFRDFAAAIGADAEELPAEEAGAAEPAAAAPTRPGPPTVLHPTALQPTELHPTVLRPTVLRPVLEQPAVGQPTVGQSPVAEPAVGRPAEKPPAEES